MFSWMRGPVGTAGGAGAGPRPVTTNWQSMAELSSSQLQPPSALMVAAVDGPGLADAVSAIQSSMPLARFTMNDSHFPSGEKPGELIRTPGGSTTFVSTPSAIRLNVMPRIDAGLCGPFVFGLMRAPASLSIGSARSAMARHARPLEQGHHVPGRADDGRRRRGSIEDVDDGLGRQLIAGLEGAGLLSQKRRGGEEHDDEQGGQRERLHRDLRHVLMAVRL